MSQRQLTNIPAKLSDFLKLAVEDFEFMRRQENVKIDMAQWLYKPKEDVRFEYENPESYKKGVCYICLAGAIIARRTKNLNLDTFRTEQIHVNAYCNKARNKLRALDLLRTGALYEGLCLFYSCESLPKDVQSFWNANPNIIDVDNGIQKRDPDNIVFRLNKLIDALRGVGL